MNNTTTAGPYTTVTYPLDYYYALFTNPITVVRFYQIGYPITFILGFLGNAASLITFLRPTLRKVSTGCLFIVLAFSDTFYLLICIFDFLEIGLKVPFYHHVLYSELCRFRSFIMDTSQVLSSWVLVTISVDRWIRTRFPYKSGSICTPKKALLVVGVLLMIDIGIHSHILTPAFGILIPGFAILSCGPNVFNLPYFNFYFLYWTVIQILIICLIPAILMLLILFDIFIKVRIRKQALIHPTNNSTQGNNKSSHQKNLQTQMFILMCANIFIFLLTTLPVAIYKITSPRQSDISTALLQIMTIWTGFAWFQTLNYAVNFYIHCLSSTLFRKEFKKQIKYLCGDQQAAGNTIEFSATGNGTRTQHH